jgi:predicted metal-dependent hydrolase
MNMDTLKAAILARNLMNEHGLEDWAFKFDTCKASFGSCRRYKKLITLSRLNTQLNYEQGVRNTILHEIAHALSPKPGHGKVWKEVCRKIGAKPERKSILVVGQ